MIDIRYRSKETTAYAREQVRDHSNVMRNYHARRPTRSIERITRAISRTNYVHERRPDLHNLFARPDLHDRFLANLSVIM